MASQMRYMQGDTKPRTYRTPSQAIMLGQAANPWGVTKQFSIEHGDLLFKDPLTGCVYPASMIPTQASPSEAVYQLAFAQYFVGVADEKISINSGEITFNVSQMYQSTVKVLTAGVFEYPCPNQTFLDPDAPLGIYATSSGISDSQKIDSIAVSTANTTINFSAGYSSTATSIVVASASTLSLTAGLSVIRVATTPGTLTNPAQTTIAGPIGTTSVTSVLLTATTGLGANSASIVPGSIIQVGSEEMYVSAIQGFAVGTSLTYAITSSQTTIVVASVYGIVPGCAVLVGTELMYVTSVNPTTLTLTVTRGYDSSSAASASAAAAVTVVPIATVTRGYNGTTAATASNASVTLVSTPPEQMLVVGVNSNTLTVVRGYNGSSANPIINGAVVTNQSYDWAAAAQSQKIGTVVPTPGLSRSLADASSSGLATPQQSRVCIEIAPALRFGGVPGPGTYTGVSGQ